MGPIRFQLADSEGKLHEYIMTTHGATEGSGLALKIMSILSGPLAEGLVAVLGSDGALQRFASEGVGAIKIDEIGSALSGLDMGALSLALSRALGDPATERIITIDLMRHVHRDGKALSNQTDYDLAFTANYLELFKLAIEVIKKNGFLPFAPT